MATTVAALVTLWLADAAATYVAARRSVADDATMLADVIASNSAAAVMFGDPVSGNEILSGLRARSSITGAAIYTKPGAMFSRYGVDFPLVAPAPGTRVVRGRVEVTRPIVFRGERIGTLCVVSHFDDAHASVRKKAIVTLILMLCVIAFAYTVSGRVQRIISGPILQLARIASRVRTDRNVSFRTIVTDTAVGEISTLAAAFDEMLEEVQRRRRDLEDQVESRTVALLQANADLTRAKEHAERIAEEHDYVSRYKQTVLNAAAEGILGLDASGHVTLVNASAARMLGYAIEDLIGRRLHDAIHDEDNVTRLPDCDVCSISVEPPLRTGRDVAFARRDGTRIPVEYTTSTMREQGVVVVTFRDITERRAVQRMQDEFVSTVSHELRTPLTSIRGALGLLASGILGDISDRARRMLGIAVTNTDRLVRLINDILDLEKMASGKVDLHRTLISAADLMREAIDVVQSTADRASVRIACESAPQMLWIDRDRIVQTLTNLLGNAVKFSPRGSEVLLAGEVTRGVFTFAVGDHGRGIPENELETIFERFKQVDASDSRDKGGSGLGLAICRSIVTAHGGRIWAESRPGEGSTFRFTLPLDLTGVSRETSVAASDPRVGPVLIVEDDQDLAGVSPPPSRRTAALRSAPRRAAADLTLAEQDRLRLGPTVFLTKSRVPFRMVESSIDALLENRVLEVAGAA